jgi:hypothetical protein
MFGFQEICLLKLLFWEYESQIITLKRAKEEYFLPCGVLLLISFIIWIQKKFNSIYPEEPITF